MTAETEIARYILVSSVLVVAVLYYFTHRTSAGTLTAGYFVLLGVTGQWWTILAAAVFTGITYGLMRLLIMRVLALPRLWVYGMSIATATTVHAALRNTPGFFDLPGNLGLVFLAGLYVTPGIIAYDLMHQGIRRTFLGLGSAILGTIAVSIPLVALNALPKTEGLAFNGNIPDYLWWLAALVSVWAALALRLARNLGTGGFIAAVFIVEVFRWDTLLVLLAFIAVARGITWAFNRWAFLTPRQGFQLSFTVGALVCWTGIYWGARWGITPCVDLNRFMLEPLIIVGLVAADLYRVNVPRVIGGLTIGSGLVALALFGVTASMPLIATLGIETAVVASILLIARPALISLFRTPFTVMDVGKAYAVTGIR